MRVGALPFEHAFRDWMEARGMTWQRTQISITAELPPTVAFRFTPARRPQRVVFALHGAGNDALFGWVGLFKRLLLEDTAVFTFDLPGHGRAAETRFDHERISAWLRGALNSCTWTSGTIPVHAIGVSLGGALLLEALPNLQRSLASATLVVAPLRIELSVRSVLGELGLPAVRLLLREREHYGLTGLIPSFGPFKRDVYPLRLEKAAPAGVFGYVDSLNEALDVLRLEEAAQAVELPVLLAYGEMDRVVPVEQGEKLAELVRRSELLRIPGGTHLSTPLDPGLESRFLSWIERWG